jgi:hypothetical protein
MRLRIMAALLAVASLTITTLADESPTTEPTLPQALDAKQKHDVAVKQAKDALHKAVIAADQQYVADLDAALKAAMSNQDIDLARAIDDQKKAAQAALKRDQAAFDTDTGQGPVAIIGAAVKQGSTSLSLPHGAQIYIYGLSTGGALDASKFQNGAIASVNDRAGHASAELAVTKQPDNQFTTGCAYYAVGGCGVSNYGAVTALYGTNEGPAANSASVDFSLNGPTTVVVVGLASSQQAITFDGLANLQTDVPAAAADGTVAMAIGHADLQAGKYTVRELTSAVAAGQDADHQADLVGVFIFSADASVVSSQSSTITIPDDVAAATMPTP